MLGAGGILADALDPDFVQLGLGGHERVRQDDVGVDNHAWAAGSSGGLLLAAIGEAAGETFETLGDDRTP